MIGIDDLKKGLVTELNTMTFSYKSDMDQVEDFVGDYLVLNGYVLSTFRVTDIPNNNRYMTIDFRDTLQDIKHFSFQILIVE